MLGQKLRQLREEKGLKQKEVAEFLFMSCSAISMYECNKRTPSHDTLKIFAKFYNVSVDYLLGNSELREVYEKISHDGITNEQLYIYRTVRDRQIEDIKITAYDKIRKGLVKLDLLKEENSPDDLRTQDVINHYISSFMKMLESTRQFLNS